MKQLICIIIVFLTSGICFISCKTQYVPVESIRTEYRDRWRTDSVYARDSIFLSVRGDTVWMEKYITRYRDKVVRDSVLRVDSIPVPFEVEKRVYVEKPLSWWQSFLMWSGKAAWLLFIPIIVYITKKRFNWLGWLIKKIF